MIIECIHVQNVRNLTSVVIEPSPGLNVFIGANASGKTAILEAIYFLSRVKSFRTPKAQHVIQYKAPSLMVTAKIRYSHKWVIKTGIENPEFRQLFTIMAKASRWFQNKLKTCH